MDDGSDFETNAGQAEAADDEDEDMDDVVEEEKDAVLTALLTHASHAPTGLLSLGLSVVDCASLECASRAARAAVGADPCWAAALEALEADWPYAEPPDKEWDSDDSIGPPALGHMLGPPMFSKGGHWRRFLPDPRFKLKAAWPMLPAKERFEKMLAFAKAVVQILRLIPAAADGSWWAFQLDSPSDPAERAVARAEASPRWGLLVKLATATAAEAGFHESPEPYYGVADALDQICSSYDADTDTFTMADTPSLGGGSSLREFYNPLLLREDAGTDAHVEWLNDPSAPKLGMQLNISEAMLGGRLYRRLRVLPLTLADGWRERAPFDPDADEH